MTTSRHTPIATRAAASAATINAPLSELDSAVATLFSSVGSGAGWASTLDGTAASGQKVVPVASTVGAVAGMPVYIGLTSGTHEVGVIDTISAGVSVTLLANLANTYGAPSPISSTPAEVADARGAYATLGGRLDAIDDFPGGASFPVSPTVGDVYWRTDWHEAYFWDGTHWLSTAIYVQHVSNEIGPVLTVAMDGYYLSEWAWPINTTGASRGLWLVGWNLSTRVAATNDASNYWQVRMYINGTAWPPLSVIWTHDDTADVQTVHPTAIGALVPAASTGGRLDIHVNAGTPGSMHANAYYEYRRVGA